MLYSFSIVHHVYIRDTTNYIQIQKQKKLNIGKDVTGISFMLYFMKTQVAIYFKQDDTVYH